MRLIIYTPSLPLPLFKGEVVDDQWRPRESVARQVELEDVADIEGEDGTP